MVRKAKPLIEPGSILPTQSPTQDTMIERILERDRLVSGRTSNENIASNTASNIANNGNEILDVQQSNTLDTTKAQPEAKRLVTITLRLPEDLNDWLDDYAHVNRKLGIKKQDLVARAVQLLQMHLNGQ